MMILLDNGHGKNTAGKKSPDKTFEEWEFNRDIVRRLSKMLDKHHIKYHILVPEDTDVSLSERARRANEYCKVYGKSNCLFLSVHANAAGNGSKWMTAQGFSCYTSKGETASDKYAEVFMQESIAMGHKTRKYSAKKYSWEENFTVLVKTQCPAVLTENFFYDNKTECEWLKSEEGRNTIANLHLRAILRIINSQ